MVSSVVAQVLSGLVERYTESNDANRNFERLEMAHIRLEAALETSDKWLKSVVIHCTNQAENRRRSMGGKIADELLHP